MTPAIRLTDDDYELLSAYLDGELSEPERVRLEARLAAEPALRAALDDLTATVQILRMAPQIATPRNFTLDPARHSRRVPWWADFRAMQLIGALGAFASILLLALGILTTTVNSGQLAPAPVSVGNSVALQTTATATALPPGEQQAQTLDKSKDLTQTAQSREPFAATAAATSVAIGPTTTPQPTMVAMIPAPASPSPASVVGLTAPTQTVSRPSVKAGVAQSGAAGAAQPLPQPTSVGAQSNAAVSEGAQSAPQPGNVVTPSSRNAAADNVGIAPTPSPLPTATQPPTATASSTASSTASLTATASVTAVAVVATSAPSTAIGAAPTLTTGIGRANVPTQPLISGPQFLLIIGIVLLVFSLMLLGIAWIRSRL